MIVSEGRGTGHHMHPLALPLSHTHPDIHLLLIKFQQSNMFGSASEHLFDMLVCVGWACMQVQVVLLSLCVLRSSVSLCVFLN